MNSTTLTARYFHKTDSTLLDEKLVEIVELPDHPWFIGVQFHPEFKSRPNKPQKLFADFIRASLLNNA